MSEVELVTDVNEGVNLKGSSTEINHNISAIDIVEKPRAMEETAPQRINGYSNAARGMDDLLPSQNLWVSKRSDPVKLRSVDKGVTMEKPITVPTFLRNTVQKYPNHTAIAVKRDGEWKKWTYTEYYADICHAAKAFIKLGLEPFGSVGIIGFNSPEWFLADLGAIFAGGLAMGIYTTNTPEACAYVATNSQANIIVAENNQQLQKILKVKDQLPHLKAIIQYTGEVANPQPFIYSWSEFMKMGDNVADSQLEERMKNLSPNTCCTLIYTSGTTGNPKGVMLSHDNFVWTSRAAGLANNLTFGDGSLVSYLPLSHVAAQLLDLYMPIAFGMGVYFAQPDALKGSLGQTLREVRPTSFFGVPRVWEKMMEKMMEAGKGASGFKRKVAAWAKGVGLKGNHAIMNNRPDASGKMKRASRPLGWGIANSLVFSKVRVALGLDRCVICLSGAAPITKDTLEYFLSLNVQIQEVYGMSECSGPHTFGRINNGNRLMSVGYEFPGIQTKLADMDEEGNGEVCMYGRHVFMGYLDNAEKTRADVDDEGWLHSGDIGRKDNDGFLFITGRIKEIIITAGGENVAPVPIEDVVKECISAVSNCMLIGDKRKFLSMLITLKTVIDPDTTEPLNTLSAPALEWCRSVGSSATSVSDILDQPDAAVLKAIQAGIDKANARSTSRAAKIQKWSLLPRDFSIPGGELGPTMKLCRPIVSKLYHKTIEAFYADT